VSDIFREVEEEVRQEQLQKWWKKYGDYVIAGVSAVVIVVAGWKLWQHYEQQQRLKASSQYESAAAMSAAGQNDLAAQAFAQVAKKAPSGYAIVAEMSRADELLASGRTNDAVAIYLKLAENNKKGLGDVARMRAAWAQADKISTDDMKKLLAPVNDGKSQWHFMAEELLAYRAFKDGRIDDALKTYKALSTNSQVPASVRQRSLAMSTFLGTSGGADFGKVPLPVQPGAKADSHDDHPHATEAKKPGKAAKKEAAKP
jgi:hypothetical protein